jgi:hypothetical protein
MRRLLHATLWLYPRSIRHGHGPELESLVEELIERDGRARPVVMGRLAFDGITQRLSSRATLWVLLITLTLTSAGGLAVSDFAAASAHQRPDLTARSAGAHVGAAAGAGALASARAVRPAARSFSSAGIIGR